MPEPVNARDPPVRYGDVVVTPWTALTICAVIAGNLYNDDKILSVAHVYQTHTEWHLKHPKL